MLVVTATCIMKCPWSPRHAWNVCGHRDTHGMPVVTATRMECLWSPRHAWNACGHFDTHGMPNIIFVVWFINDLNRMMHLSVAEQCRMTLEMNN